MAEHYPPLLRLIYASRVAAAWAVDFDGVLFDILADAIPRNRARGLTGLLITHAGWVLQGLEGPPESVCAVFSGILEDHRHVNVVVRVNTATAERLFPRWSLCARALSSADVALLADLGAGTVFDPAEARPETLVRLMRIISKAHDHRFDAQQRMIARR